MINNSWKRINGQIVRSILSSDSKSHRSPRFVLLLEDLVHVGVQKKQSKDSNTKHHGNSIQKNLPGRLGHELSYTSIKQDPRSLLPTKRRREKEKKKPLLQDRQESNLSSKRWLASYPQQTAFSRFFSLRALLSPSAGVGMRRR